MGVMETSKIMRNTLLGLLSKNKRIDERKFDEYREIEIFPDISKNAEGSCKVKIGKTIVVAGVKIDLAEPFADSPDSGVLVVNAELLPLSYAGFEPGPPGIEAIELARIVDRGIRESEFIDLKKLCIEEGKKVYSIFIDIYTINYDGNLIDASFLASVIALKRAFLPKIEKVYDDYRVVYGEKTSQGLPLAKTLPFMCTVYKLDRNFFLDANMIEEKASDAMVSIAFKDDTIHAIQKNGSDVLSIEELKKAVELAKKGVQQIKKKVEKFL
jgi:exosome complex component RRP42